MTTLRAAVRAWNQYALVPDRIEWDAYEGRLFRYDHYWNYYDNAVYSQLVAYANQHKEFAKLGRFTRAIYNPVNRLVNLYVAKTYGGSIDYETMLKGAIPIAQLDDRARLALARVYQWSNMASQKSLLVRYGALMGDFGIKVCDDPFRQQVRLEVLHPSYIKYTECDATGAVTKAVIEYDVTENEPGGMATGNIRQTTYKYTETIDATEFVTYKDGKEFGFYPDETGTLTPRWANRYGFVPLALGKHMDAGRAWGMNAFHASLPKIDEINDAASILNDQIRKAVNVLWYYAGVSGEEELDVSTETKDEIPAVYGPAGSQPYPMVAPVDLAAASVNVQNLLLELERDMPELALHRVREAGQMTAPGIKAGYSDAIDRIIEARGNYDGTVVRANSMALAIGGEQGYPGVQGFRLVDYTRGNLMHSIAERPVIEDELDKNTRVTILMQSGAPERAVWQELGIPEDTINQWEMMQQQKQEADIQRQIDILVARPDQLPPPPSQPQLGAGN